MVALFANQVPDTFGPINLDVVLDGSGNGQVSFKATGSNVRLSNIFFRVTTSVNQAVCTIYKGQVATGNQIFNSNSGSTGMNCRGNVDLFDGETCFVRWTGGDAGAIATATFTGGQIPFGERVGTSALYADDPIAAGDGSLIFPQIKSPDFQTGVAGWIVRRDGSVEFSDAVIRGTLSADNGNVVVDDNGVRITGSQEEVLILDTGIVVNEVPDTGGFASITSAVNFGGTIFLNPDDSAIGVNLSPARLYVERSETLVSSVATLHLFSPKCVGLNISAIALHGQASDAATDNSFIEISAPRGIYWSDYNVDSGRGWVNGDGITASSAAIGAAETTVLTIPNFTYKKNRAYMMSLSGMVTSSVAPNNPVLRFRKTNPAGQQLDVWRVACPVAATTFNAHFQGYFNVGAADVTATLVVTLIGSGAFNAVLSAAGTSPASFNVYDVGDASAFSWAATLV